MPRLVCVACSHATSAACCDTLCACMHLLAGPAFPLAAHAQVSPAAVAVAAPAMAAAVGACRRIPWEGLRSLPSPREGVVHHFHDRPDAAGIVAIHILPGGQVWLAQQLNLQPEKGVKALATAAAAAPAEAGGGPSPALVCWACAGTGHGHGRLGEWAAPVAVACSPRSARPEPGRKPQERKEKERTG